MSPDPTSYYGLFKGLVFALYCTCFMSVISGLFFLFASLYLPEDKQNVLKRSKLEQARLDVIDEHLDERQREEEERQRELFQKKMEAAAKRQNGGANHADNVLMHYVRRTSNDGEVNIGFYPDEEEMGETGAGQVKTAQRVRPVSRI